jgi:hypothetical protein
MPEGWSAAEVGKEISQDAKQRPHTGHEQRDRMLAIVEAILRSLVTLAAAWSGYSAAPPQANRASLDAQELRNCDSSSVRYGLVGIGGVVLVASLVLLSQLPLPPR